MTTIYSICYSQNGSAAEDGPSLADFWCRSDAERAAKHCRDCAVVAREVSEEYAEANCETLPR